MKRRIAVLLAIALLLSLSACGDDPVVGDPPLLFTKPAVEEDPTKPSNIVPTQVPTVAPTVIPTEPPTEEPTQAPTQAPTEGPAVNMAEILAEWEVASQYGMSPSKYLLFRYKANSEYDYGGKSFDRSNMIEGYYYAVHDGDVYLIPDQQMIYTDPTNEHIYYMLPDERGRVYRSDLYGNQKEVIYEAASGHEVTSFSYAGKDKNGILFVVEDKQRLFQYDLTSKKSVMLLEFPVLQGVYFGYFTYDLPVADEILANGPFLDVYAKEHEDGEGVWYRYWLVSKKLEKM